MKENRFPDRFKMLKKEAGLTDEELGKILGKSRSAIGHYSNGIRKPDIDDLMTIAAYFGVSVSFLVGDSDKRDIDVYEESINGHQLRIEYKTDAYKEKGFSHEDAMKIISKLESIGIDVNDLLK